MDIACIQKTRWKGEKSKKCNTYKLWYLGLESANSRVGISTRVQEDVREKHAQFKEFLKFNGVKER